MRGNLQNQLLHDRRLLEREDLRQGVLPKLHKRERLDFLTDGVINRQQCLPILGLEHLGLTIIHAIGYELSYTINQRTYNQD